MDDLRRNVLLAHQELLESKPYDEHGCRYEVIGSMFSFFNEEDGENAVVEGMIQLGKDMNELGMTLSSYPHRPDLLCILQKK